VLCGFATGDVTGVEHKLADMAVCSAPVATLQEQTMLEGQWRLHI
jgi:hypothetical protein